MRNNIRLKIKNTCRPYVNYEKYGQTGQGNWQLPGTGIPATGSRSGPVNYLKQLQANSGAEFTRREFSS